MKDILLNILIGVGILTCASWSATLLWLVTRIKKLQRQEEWREAELDRSQFWPRT